MVDVFLLSTTSQSVFVPLDLVTFDGIQVSEKVLHGAEPVFFTNFKYTGLGSFDVDDILSFILLEDNSFIHLAPFHLIAKVFLCCKLICC